MGTLVLVTGLVLWEGGMILGGAGGRSHKLTLLVVGMQMRESLRWEVGCLMTFLLRQYWRERKERLEYMRWRKASLTKQGCASDDGLRKTLTVTDC